MDARVITEPLEPWKEIQEFLSAHAELRGKCGAMVVFVGTMRAQNEGETVQSMHLEHYPAMTQAHLEEIARQARDKFGLSAVLLRHRVGEIHPGDDIVLVAVWAEHRKAAYEGNRFLMEDLKSTAPFWKEETLAGGERRWVEENTPG